MKRAITNFSKQIYLYTILQDTERCQLINTPVHCELGKTEGYYLLQLYIVNSARQVSSTI